MRHRRAFFVLFAVVLVTCLGMSQPALAATLPGTSTSPTAPGRMLSPQEAADWNFKQQRFHTWQTNHPVHTTVAPQSCRSIASKSATASNSPAPNLTCFPNTTLGGSYIGEPDPTTFPSGYVGNWCGPASGTNVMLHWDSNQVYNHSAVTVLSDPRVNTTYTGGLAWMAWFADQIWLPTYGQSGVSTYNLSGTGSPYRGGANPNVLAYGLNQVVVPIYGRNYYYSTNENAESTMWNDVTFDVGNDRRPVVYDTETNYLAGWNSGLNIGHFVEGYG